MEDVRQKRNLPNTYILHLMSSISTQRYAELDLLRTLAIVMMIVYHAAFDLSTFYGFGIDLSATNWELVRLTTVTIFLALVGVTFAIAQTRSPSYGAQEWTW